jgi:hypothetical protein
VFTDVRDVIFQANPFASLALGDGPEESERKKHQCLFFEENAERSIFENSFNWDWIETLYRSHSYLFKPLRIICSGVSICSNFGALVYLDAMKQDFLDTSFIGYDQGYHQGVIYLGKMNNRIHYRICPNGNPVFTVGMMRQWNITATNIVPPDSGHVCSIIHQYDRHEAMVKFVEALFVNYTIP